MGKLFEIEITDKGNPFLRVPGQDIFQPSPAYSNISKVFCESRSKSVTFYQISLVWVSGKVVNAFNRLLEHDIRRLSYFKKQRIPPASKHVRKTAERSDNPVWDLRILRDKTYAKIKTLRSLGNQLRESLEFAEGEIKIKQKCYQTPILKNFNALEKRLHDFLELLKREMDDITADRQQELTISQLEESRKSIEQNNQVRKLTILAFFFVPISTVSSIFGMNVRELQLPQYQPHIWVFVVVVCCVIGVSVMLASYGFLRNALMGIGIYTKEVLIWYKKAIAHRNWLLPLFPFFLLQLFIYFFRHPSDVVSMLKSMYHKGRERRLEKKQKRKEKEKEQRWRELFD